jgi:hypothetical protein
VRRGHLKTAEWATEALYIAKADAYGKLRAPSSGGSYRLPDDYVSMATDDVALPCGSRSS